MGESERCSGVGSEAYDESYVPWVECETTNRFSVASDDIISVQVLSRIDEFSYGIVPESFSVVDCESGDIREADIADNELLVGDCSWFRHCKNRPDNFGRRLQFCS